MPSSRSPSARTDLALVRMRPVILRVAARYGASHVRVFGSFARGEQGSRSDVDLLVTLPPRSSLLALAVIKADLEKALGRRVDVIADDSIKPLLRERILSEALAL